MNSSITVSTQAPQAIGSFFNGWRDAYAARYYKDVDGIVHLSGLVDKNGASASGGSEHVFSLPEGYRPQYDERIPSATPQGAGFLWIRADGEVWATTAVGSGFWVSLSGATFRAA